MSMRRYSGYVGPETQTTGWKRFLSQYGPQSLFVVPDPLIQHFHCLGALKILGPVHIP